MKQLATGVLYIDLKKAFDTIDNAILLRKLANYGLDLGSLRFFASYLGNRSQKCYVNGVLSSASKLRCGVPQGSILGPLFFLIYISDLPNCLNTACTKMFADDTNITISGSSLADLEQKTNLELLNLHCWLTANKLSLKVAKTEFVVIGSRQKILAESHKEIKIKLEDQVISKVDHAKSLGLIIDNQLSWSNHVNDLCKKVTSAIGALRRIRALISQSTAVLIYNSLIQPHFDYCSLVWDGLSDQLSDKLQKLQNRAATVILKANYGTTIGVKIVETLLSFRVDLKLGAKMAPSPAPPGQCCVFLFSTSLVDSGTTLIRVGEGGVSRKRTFWTSFLCKQ